MKLDLKLGKSRVEKNRIKKKDQFLQSKCRQNSLAIGVIIGLWEIRT